MKEIPVRKARVRPCCPGQRLSLAWVLGAVVLTAGAADSSQLQVLDMNRDSFLNRDEAQGLDLLMEQWQELDRNGDGVLDAAEFTRFQFTGGRGSSSRDRQRQNR